MADANKVLTHLICDALRAEGVIVDGIVIELAETILSGKMKSEDWYSMIERSLPVPGVTADGT